MSYCTQLSLGMVADTARRTRRCEGIQGLLLTFVEIFYLKSYRYALLSSLTVVPHSRWTLLMRYQGPFTNTTAVRVGR